MKHFFPAPPTAAGLLSAAVLTLLAGTTCFAQNPDITVLQEDLQLGPMSVVSLAGSINVPRIVTLTVRNDGTSDLTGLAVSKGGPHASLFTVTQPGVTTLAAGNETTFDVTFTPTESGTRLATLQIGSNDPDENPTDLVLSGTIAAPDIALNSDSQAVLMDGVPSPELFFESTGVGNPVTQTFTIRNLGTGPLTGLALSVEGVHASDFVVGSLSNSPPLAAGEETSFEVTFTPSALGTRMAVLHIASNDENESPFDIPLSGGIPTTTTFTNSTGITIPSFGNASPFPSTIAVTGIGPIRAVRVKLNGLTHPRPSDLSVELILPNGDTKSLLSQGDGGQDPVSNVAITFALRGGSSISGQLTDGSTYDAYFESAASEKPNGTWSLAVSDGATGESGSIASWSIEVDHGSGAAEPEIYVEWDYDSLVDSSDEVSFGGTTVTTGSLVETFTIRNDGTANLSGLSVTVDGANPTNFVAGALGATTLAPGASTTFAVTFTPSAAGLRTANLHIANNDADESPFDISLGGFGSVGTVTGNNHFASRTNLGNSPSAFVRGSTVGATLESGEVRPGGTGGSSVWFQWTSPSTGWVALSLHQIGEQSASMFALFSGTGSLASLQMLGFSVNEYGGRLTFLAQADTIYQIGVYRDELDSPTGSGAEFELSIHPVPTPSPMVTGVCTVPGSVNVTEAAKNVTVLTAMDSSADLVFGFHREPAYPSGATYEGGLRLGLFTIEFPVANVSRFQQEIPRFAMHGRWIPTIYAAGDWSPTGNDLVPDEALIPTGMTDSLQVVNSGPVDTGPPVLVNVTNIPASVNVATAPASFQIDLEIEDPGAGFAGGFVQLRDHLWNPIQAPQVFFNSNSLQTGNANSGTYRVAIAIPQGTTTATYQFVIELQDQNGKRSDYEGPFSIQVNGTPRPQEIAVTGNSINITDGDNTPDTEDFTQFGPVPVAGGTLARTFTITNSGTANLTVGPFTAGADFVVSGAPTSVPAGQSRTFVVTFDPSAPGARTAIVSFVTNDSDENPFNFSIRGTGTAPEIAVTGNNGTVDIPDGDTTPSLSDHTDFGGTDVSGGTVVRTFTIGNLGNAPLTAGAITVGGAHAADFAVTSVATSPIAASGSTTFQVTFNPSSGGVRIATLSFVNNDSNENPFNFSIQGTGLLPEVAVAGNLVNIADGDAVPSLTDHTDFGAVSVSGGIVTRTFTVSNLGAASLATGAVTIGGTHAADFTVASPLVSPVGSGGSVSFQISFDPSAAGLRTATLSFATNDLDENPFNFSIQGTGAVPEIVVKGNNVTILDGDAAPAVTDHTDFGPVALTGGTLIRTFVISNTGTASLSVNTVEVGGSDAADFSVSTGPASSVAAAGTTSFQVTFDPSAGGTRTATLSFANNDSDENPFNFTIRGTGTGPEIALKGNGTDIGNGDVTPTTLDHTDFGGSVSGAPARRTFTITNPGTANLTLGTVTVTGDNALEFTVNPQPATTIASGASSTFQVSFSTTATGIRTATLNIPSNDADENPFTFSIQGSGTTDGDGDGFSDYEAAGIDALRTRYMVGDTLGGPRPDALPPIDLNFIGLVTGQTLSVTGLPPGLSFSTTTKLITGTITGDVGDAGVEIRKTLGAVVKSRPFHLVVVPYMFAGSFEALIKNATLPAGKAKLVVSGRGVFSATMELQNQSSRATSGSFTHAPDDGWQTVRAVFAPVGSLPETTVEFRIRDVAATTDADRVEGSHGGNSLVGFRLIKPDRSPSQKVTVAFENLDAGDRSSTPRGSGYATGTLNSAGQLSLTGALGDAQPLTTALNVSQNNQAVVFVQPYTIKDGSFFGGIITIGDLGSPGRGGSSTPQHQTGLQWRKTGSLSSTSYRGGFGTGTPLNVSGRVSKWVSMVTAEGLSLALGLPQRELHVTHLDPPEATLPQLLSLRNTFNLVRILPLNSVPFTGTSNASTGTFSGTMTLPAPAPAPGLKVNATINGVYLQDSNFGTQVGAGLVKIPIFAPVGQPTLPAGSFETSGIQFNNE